MKDERLVVRFAEKTEDKAAIAEGFVDPIYTRTYATTPPVPDAYAVIESRGRVRACLGIDWPAADGLLSIERAYGIQARDYPREVSIANKMQLNRWVSTMPQASALPVLAAMIYGLAKGRLYGLVEHNAIVHHRAQLLGIPFIDIPHGPVNLEFIREENRGYYAKRDMGVYLMDLDMTRKALEGKVPPFELLSP